MNYHSNNYLDNMSLQFLVEKNKEFTEIYKTKNSFATKHLVMYVFKNCDTERNRLGISVSHKVGNSVVRHTLTRRVREIFRKNEKYLEGKNDIVIVLRIGSDKEEFFNLNEEFID